MISSKPIETVWDACSACSDTIDSVIAKFLPEGYAAPTLGILFNPVIGLHRDSHSWGDSTDVIRFFTSGKEQVLVGAIRAASFPLSFSEEEQAFFKLADHITQDTV